MGDCPATDLSTYYMGCDPTAIRWREERGDNRGSGLSTATVLPIVGIIELRLNHAAGMYIPVIDLAAYSFNLWFQINQRPSATDIFFKRWADSTWITIFCSKFGCLCQVNYLTHIAYLSAFGWPPTRKLKEQVKSLINLLNPKQLRLPSYLYRNY